MLIRSSARNHPPESTLTPETWRPGNFSATNGRRGGQAHGRAQRNTRHGTVTDERRPPGACSGRLAEVRVHIETLAMQADGDRAALARTRLERSARRWSERPTFASLRELQRAAASFRDAQRASDDAVRAWARALASHEALRSRTEGAAG